MPNWLIIGMIGVLLKASIIGVDKHMTQEDTTEKEGIHRGWSFESIGKTSSIASSQRIETIEILRGQGGFLN